MCISCRMTTVKSHQTTEKDQLASKQPHPGLLSLHLQSCSVTTPAALCLIEPQGDRVDTSKGGRTPTLVLTSTLEIAVYKDKAPYLFSSCFRELTGTNNFQKDERS